jgi:arylsulfatase A-like enzyme
MWREKDFNECASNATCACPINPRVITQTPFLPSPDSAETCPLGYSPTPVLETATNNHRRRTVKRNVVLFLLDDLDELVTPYWQAMPFAKTLFEDNGVKFTNAFSSTSVCCAARCQLLTGLYGHNVGVLTNGGKYGGLNAFKAPSAQDGSRLKDDDGKCINNEDRTLPVLLQQAGYKTGAWGKYINGIENDATWALSFPVPPGWDEFAIATTRNFYAGYNYGLSVWDSSRASTNISYEYRGIRPQDYATDVLKEKTTAWVDRVRETYGDVPLFLYINPSAPHFPITAAPRHKYAYGQWNDLYNTTIPTRPNWNEDVSDKPFYVRDNAVLRSTLVNSPWYRLEFVKRMGSLMAVDEMIQGVYNKFSEREELDKTVFIMTSDNGYLNGAHGLAHKMAPYEESIKVPLYFSGGGVFEGEVIDEPALLIDLAPTILDFANLEAPCHMDGKSWWKNLLIRLDAGGKRKEIYLQYKKYFPGAPDDTAFSEILPAILAITPNYIAVDIPPYRALRKEDIIFIENLQVFTNGTTTVEYEAYDLEDDPYQLNNIIDDLSNRKFERLLDDLNEISECTGSDCW